MSPETTYNRNSPYIATFEKVMGVSCDEIGEKVPAEKESRDALANAFNRAVIQKIVDNQTVGVRSESSEASLLPATLIAKPRDASLSTYIKRILSSAANGVTQLSHPKEPFPLVTFGFSEKPSEKTLLTLNRGKARLDGVQSVVKAEYLSVPDHIKKYTVFLRDEMLPEDPERGTIAEYTSDGVTVTVPLYFKKRKDMEETQYIRYSYKWNIRNKQLRGLSLSSVETGKAEVQQDGLFAQLNNPFTLLCTDSKSNGIMTEKLSVTSYEKRWEHSIGDPKTESVVIAVENMPKPVPFDPYENEPSAQFRKSIKRLWATISPHEVLSVQIPLYVNIPVNFSDARISLGSMVFHGDIISDAFDQLPLDLPGQIYITNLTRFMSAKVVSRKK